jgi:suppressor for copper-sensitivity B
MVCYYGAAFDKVSVMKKILGLLFFILLLFPLPALALTGEWQKAEQGDLRLLASTKVAEDGRLYAGLHLKLQPHWHVYWRSPGDAGLPPMPEWKDSSNIASTTLLYPWPKRAEMQGLETFGYEEEVVFPVLLERKDAAQATNINLPVSFLVCADICVPMKFTATLNIPASYATPAAGDEATPLLKTYYDKVPLKQDGVFSGLTYQPDRKALRLDVTGGRNVAGAEVIIETGDGGAIPTGDAAVNGASIELPVKGDFDVGPLIGKGLIVSLKTADGKAVESMAALQSGSQMASATAAPTAPDAVTPPAPGTEVTPMMGGSLWLMIGFALIGGLILNLMPCVLPVLAIKSLSFISHGGGTPSGVRLSFLATSAGIIASFLVMAAAIIGLKEAGMSVGWGVQFQHPVFLSVLIVLLLLFAANMWGLFEIPLPRFLADRLSWTQGHGNLAKDFFSGAFATVLATPCTAPFLGTAVGFALAGGSGEVLAIFLALGIGLALPYLLIATFPKTATLLPKPGAWMVAVRKFMGALLLLTAAWLGFVLSQQFMDKVREEARWQNFDEARIAQLVTQGKVVLVDVTADWCLTCQVNKKLVLDNPNMEKVLADPQLVLMKADWTKPDTAIAAYLKKYGRFGIPFNIAYGPAAPQGTPLPEILSREAVLEGLKKAGLAGVPAME